VTVAPSVAVKRQARVAVVTGGGSGIGEAICHKLAEAGHRVAVLDIEPQAAGRVAAGLRAEGTKALDVAVDVSNRTGVESAFDVVRAELGPTEILVTSAGLCLFADFGAVTDTDWRRVLDVNLTGTFLCCQVALPDMVAGGWGRIVTISSSAAQRGSPKAPHYAAAKGGVLALTRSLALAYAPHGITVNTIPPSGIETPMQHAGQAAGHLPPNDIMASAVPLGHLGTPEDVAAAAAFLTSDEAGYVTGQVLGVNGGQVLS
jgi:2-hydroxycyclohexanecarboxyl-CoA dehydrogenase